MMKNQAMMTEGGSYPVGKKGGKRGKMKRSRK
jgi:hypothetical protein